MLKPEIQKIVILGAGRLAVNLSMAIHKKGYDIVEVCNRTESKGKRLAGKLKARYIPEPEMITSDADLYILAVSDTAIPLLLDRIKTRNRLIIHTSGSVKMGILRKVSENFGVIYPPQTFTDHKLLNFRMIPLCIEASSGKNLLLLKSFADSLSEKVYMINSDQRRILHLSAVFASNFNNFMVAISQELLLENGMDFRILEPIIRQTAGNASSGDVFKMQTGPAVREDRETIREHLQLLSNHPDYKKIYDLITRNIIQRKKK
ncbi:MAG: DUF2520 domain-containing protein [Bacteroidales bacterium]|jgi:predicted short-subunit dehydrogenase-like oxidoreductase (DUF2520 family)